MPSCRGAMYMRVCDNFGPDAGTYLQPAGHGERIHVLEAVPFYKGTATDFGRLPSARIGLNHLKLGQYAMPRT
jgi:hypothetical protein